MADGDPDLGKGERKILTAVAQYPAGVTREQLTVLTGYKRSSRDTYLQRLTAGGYVTSNGNGTLHVTQPGVAALGDFEPLPTGDVLRAYWLQRLPKGEREILDELCRNFPRAIDRDTLSAATEYKRSSRDTYLQRLGARKLVEIEHGGLVRASEELFDA